MPARRAGLDGACWPTDLEAIVLRAAALEPEAGARAWRDDRSRVDIPALWDAELYRLLPAVYANLRATGTDDPDLDLMKGLYRRAFYSNTMVVHHTLPGIALLRESGIDPVVLKGLAIALLHRRDLAARPMGDVDVVVPVGDADTALATLVQHGWSRVADPVRTRALVQWRHGINCSTPAGGRIDLHWRLRRSTAPPGTAEPDDLGAAETVDLPIPDGPVLRALAPADLLLHTIEHGARIGSDAHVRWAVDAAVIVRSAGAGLDWARLVRTSGARRTTLQVRNALAFLTDVVEVDVPAEVLQELRTVPVGQRERRVFAVLSGARPSISPWRLWCATSADWPASRAARAFPRFLRDSWGLRSVAQIPFHAFGPARRRRRQW